MNGGTTGNKKNRGCHAILEHEYNVDDYNAKVAHDNDVFGTMGSVLPIYSGIATELVSPYQIPDLSIKQYHLVDGSWVHNDNIAIEVYMLPGERQPCIVKVSESVSERVYEDYYQLIYTEVVPRLKMLFNYQTDQPFRLYIADVNNIQFEGWLMENGMLKRSDKIVREVKSENENKTVRNKYISTMEQRKEKTGD